MEKKLEKLIKKFLSRALDEAIYIDEPRHNACIAYAETACYLIGTLIQLQEPRIKTEEK